MKVIALQRHWQKTEEFILPSDKNELQRGIKNIFASTKYDIILAKFKNQLFLLELIIDKTQTDGLNVRDPQIIDYTNTKINYHPLANKL